MSFIKKHLVKAAMGAALVCVLATPAAAEEMKIGVVSLQAIVERAPQTKAVMENLREEFAPRQREILAKQKQIEDMQEKVKKDLSAMSDVERRNAEKDLRDLQRDFQRLSSEYQEDSNVRQNEEFDVLQRSILKEVQGYAQRQGYDLIVGDNVLFVSTAANITEEVLRAVEANYQAAAR